MSSTIDTTISGLQQHFSKLYGNRNIILDSSFNARATLMTERMGSLADVKQKGADMPRRLAAAFNYFMNLAGYFYPSVDLQRYVMLKFPSFGCVYCLKMPCVCSNKRQTPEYDRVFDEMQRDWTLSMWQDHFKAVYGHFNIGRFEKAYGRLGSELGELYKLMAFKPNTPNSPKLFLRECGLELADAFNWLVTLAYIEDVDLEAAVLAGYSACPICHLIPCDCPLISLSPDGQFFCTSGRMDRETGTVKSNLLV
jgi:hypothetical protein